MSVRQILNKIGLAICVFVIVSPAIFFFLWMLSLSVDSGSDVKPRNVRMDTIQADSSAS